MMEDIIYSVVWASGPMTAKQISEKVGLGPRTVRKYLKQLVEKEVITEYWILKDLRNTYYKVRT